MKIYKKLLVALVFILTFSVSYAQNQLKGIVNDVNGQTTALSLEDELNSSLGYFQIQSRQSSGKQLITDDLMLVVQNERLLYVDKYVEFNTGVYIYLPSQQSIESDDFVLLDLYKTMTEEESINNQYIIGHE